MRLDKQLIPFYTLASITIIGVLFVSAHAVFLTPLKIKQLDAQINSEVQKIKRRGEPVSLKEFKLPAVPDNENAILIYKKACALREKIYKELSKDRSLYYKEEDSSDRLRGFRGSQPPSRDPEDIQNTRSFLDKHKECLELCRQAARLDKYSFTIDYSKQYNIYRNNKFGDSRHLFGLLDAEITLRIIDNQPKAALESAYTSIRMLRLMEEPPGAINTLVRIAFCATALNGVKKIINETPLDKQDIEKLLKEMDSDIAPSYLKGLRSERCQIIESPRCIVAQLIEADLKTIFLSALNRLDSKIDLFLHNSLYGYLNWKEEKLYCIKQYSALIELAKLPPSQTKEMWPDKNPELFCCWFFPSEEKNIYINAYHTQARQDMLRLALLLENFKIQSGRYPDSLAALVPGTLKTLPKDPFSGNDFIYRKEGSGFMLYSVGKNFADDNGVFNYDEKKDDIVIKRRIP